MNEISKDLIAEKGIRNNKDIFNPSGNRKSWKQIYDPYTLENVIKLMRGDIRGEEGFMYGLGNIRAGMAKEFKSIKEIKDNKKFANIRRRIYKDKRRI